MSDDIELLDDWRDLTNEEEDAVTKIVNRKELVLPVTKLREMDVKYIRQNNFTICLFSDGREVAAGCSKKHPDYDPEYNPEAGKSVAFVRAIENLCKTENG